MGLISLCFCFPPSAKVLTKRGQVKISDLKPSDILITIVRNKWGGTIHKETPFLAFLHFDPNIQGLFLTLKCENGSELQISEEHLVFRVTDKNKWEAVRSKEIRAGDRLITFDKKEIVSADRVVGVEKRIIQGLFAPLSLTGTLIVDNVLTSCYAHADCHQTAHSAFLPWRIWYRMALKFKDKSNEPGRILTEGIHPYAKALRALADYLPFKITSG